ncbi:MAG: hypothetical protein JOZ52_06420 [Acidobacteria bacterium]|nr:hypothetical protein [Acidobacteriota bacterium]
MAKLVFKAKKSGRVTTTQRQRESQSWHSYFGSHCWQLNLTPEIKNSWIDSLTFGKGICEKNEVEALRGRSILAKKFCLTGFTA